MYTCHGCENLLSTLLQCLWRYLNMTKWGQSYWSSKLSDALQLLKGLLNPAATLSLLARGQGWGGGGAGKRHLHELHEQLMIRFPKIYTSKLTAQYYLNIFTNDVILKLIWCLEDKNCQRVVYVYINWESCAGNPAVSVDHKRKWWKKEKAQQPTFKSLTLLSVSVGKYCCL